MFLRKHAGYRVVREEDRAVLVLDEGEEADHGEHHGQRHEHHQHQARVQPPAHPLQLSVS